MIETTINGANIYNSKTGQFEKKNLLLSEGNIQHIYTGSIDTENRQAIDGSDTYITPGFIDTCSQLGLKEKGISWQGSDDYEPHSKKGYELLVSDGIYPFDEAFNDAVKSGVTTAHIVSSPENVIGAQTAVIHTHGKTVDEMVIHEQFGYSFSMGDTPKNAYWTHQKAPLTRMGIAHKLKNALSELNQVEAPMNKPIFIRAHRSDDIQTAQRIVKDLDMEFILVHATEYGMALNPTLPQPDAIIGGPCFRAIDRYDIRNLHPSLYRTLADVPVPFTFATDHPTSSISHLALEGSLALKEDVSEKTILNGLTKHAAELLHIDHLTGSIQEGLQADLVMWNAHPLDLTAKPIRTWIKGTNVFEEAKIS